MSEKGKKPTTEKRAKSEKGEKTPPMFGTPIFTADRSKEKSSGSLSLAILRHIGEEPQDEHASMVEDLQEEIAADGGEFLPKEPLEEPEEQPPATTSVSARTCLPPEPPIKEHEAEQIPAKEQPLDPEFGQIFDILDKQNIGQAVLDEIEKRNEDEKRKRETGGFTADGGDRARIMLPDDPKDPDRVARLTRIGLELAKLADKKRNEK